MRLWHKRNIARSPIHGRDPRKSGPLLDIILGNLRKSLGRRSVSGRPLPAIGPGVALPDAKRQMSMPPRSVAQWPEHRSPKPGVAGSSPATPANKIRHFWHPRPERTEPTGPNLAQTNPAAVLGPFPLSFWQPRDGA